MPTRAYPDGVINSVTAPPSFRAYPQRYKMKRAFLALSSIALLTSTVFAGGYYNSQELNKYSNDGEVYYRGISSKDSDGGLLLTGFTPEKL